MKKTNLEGKLKKIISSIYTAQMYFVYFLLFIMFIMIVYVGILVKESVITYKNYAHMINDTSKSFTLDNTNISVEQYKKVISDFNLEKEVGKVKSNTNLVYAKETNDGHIEIWGENFSSYDSWKNAIRNIMHSFNQQGLTQWDITVMCAGSQSTLLQDKKKCQYPYFAKIKGKIIKLRMIEKEKKEV